jgi:Pyridoxal-phosphate dependent enzyme
MTGPDEMQGEYPFAPGRGERGKYFDRYHGAATIEDYAGVRVVRDDLLEGGSKIRFLGHLIPADTREVVYGGPFCGGAAVALSVLARQRGIRCTLFYAKRAELHARQRTALANGATIYQVRFGYMTTVQAKARRYAADHGALLLPLGFDRPAATAPFVEAMRGVRAQLGAPPSEVWCATGSGMLARCLALAFPDSRIHAVAVGLHSRWGAQAFPPNVQVRPAPYRFEQPARTRPPFPSCPNYDAKAWEICAAEGRPGRLFWNVLG